MKKNKLILKNNIIILYIFLILLPYILNININDEIIKNKEKIDMIKKKVSLLEYFENDRDGNKKRNRTDDRPPSNPEGEYDLDYGPGERDPDDGDYDDEEKEALIRNLTEEIHNYDEEIKRLNNEINKRKIYIIFLSILAVILFLMIIIYSSIKCYILCTKKNVQEYRVSNLNINRFGEVYIDDNGEERISKMSSKNLNDDCADAPIYSDKKSNNNQVNTFNPDNYIYSSQDKKLYKPYNIEEMQ